MKKALIISTLAFMTWALLSSCCKKTTDPANIDGSEFDDFPNSVGCQWVYEVYDSLMDVTDTVTVAIIDTTTLADIIPAAVWVFTWNGSIDTQYVSVVNDTVSIYPTRDTSFLDAMYIYPLEVGASWTYRHRLGNATSIVDGSGVFSVDSVIYRNSFRIETDIRGIVFDDFSTCSVWLASKTGMIWMNLYEEFNYSLHAIQRWELIDFVSP
jgi:hypothetical protein